MPPEPSSTTAASPWEGLSGTPAPLPPPAADGGGYITRRQFYLALLVCAVLGGIIGAFLMAATNVGQVRETAAPNVAVANGRVKGTGLSNEALYRQAAPGTVYVQVLTASGGQSGSGFVINHAGDILTNEHVVAGAKQVEVTFQSNVSVLATIIGSDTTDDLALIHVNPSHLALHPLTLGNSSSVLVGDPVAAIGAPYGQEFTLTTGVISATGRDITSPNGFPISGALQTDAPINPGNSGGPLLDAGGRVVGINAQISTTTGSSDGVGFAIPINLAKEKLSSLQRGGVVREAWLGIAGGNVTDLPSSVGVTAKHGIYVEQVTAGGPAAKAGLRAGTKQVTTAQGDFYAGGDIIIALGGQTLQSFAALQRIISSSHPGEKLRLTYLRAGRIHRTVVVLGTQSLASQPLSIPS